MLSLWKAALAYSGEENKVATSGAGSVTVLLSWLPFLPMVVLLLVVVVFEFEECAWVGEGPKALATAEEAKERTLGPNEEL